MKFAVATLFWDLRSLDLITHKHPLLSSGDDFVVLSFGWCHDTRPFVRVFKLFVRFSWGFLWAVLDFLL